VLFRSLTQVLDWLAAHPVDALVLQETKLTDDKFPTSDFGAATGDDCDDLGRCLGEVSRRLQGVLADPPFNLLLHTAPNTEAFGSERDMWRTLAWDYHWHLELLPRLTQVAGFEAGTDFYINPVAPEEAARFLREAGSGTP